MFKVKTYNAISSKGLNRFDRDHYEVASEISTPDAYVLRSHKLHGEPIPESLTISITITVIIHIAKSELI